MLSREEAKINAALDVDSFIWQLERLVMYALAAQILLRFHNNDILAISFPNLAKRTIYSFATRLCVLLVNKLLRSDLFIYLFISPSRGQRI